MKFICSILTCAILTLLLAIPAAAQQPISHETTAVTSSTAVGLLTTTSNPSGSGPASQCNISVENGAVRFWVDGGTPTGSSGHLVAAGGAPILLTSIQAITGFLAIAVNQAAVLQTTCARGNSPTALQLIMFYASPGLLPLCNGVQKTNCTPKGF
jgi:hypothetical protein